jgi:holo-[acyl-carrier protein] synthase
MSILGHGIDLVETARIGRLLRDHPERFLDRVLTPAERAYCERHKFPLPHVAGRFAAKEAILKVIGTGWRGGIAWTDIEILNDDAGQPHVSLSGHTREVADRLGINTVLLSITHTEHYASASAIGLG